MTKQFLQPLREEIEIKKYLSEASDEINSFIFKQRRILLNANPGSGKTFFVAGLCINHLKNKKEGRIIFCSPFLIIQDQFKRELVKNNVEVNLELNSQSPRKHLIPTDKVITTTYKSLHLISNDLKSDDLLIVDEAHSLLNTYGYGAYKEFYSTTIKILYHTPAKITLMTGTPYSGITKILNLSELKIIKNDIQAKINIQYSNEKNTALALAFAQDCLIQFGTQSLNIIYIKDREGCERIKSVIEDNLHCKAFVLTASDKETVVYKDLSTVSLIPKDINFLITTNVISTGANILNNNVGKALMLNEHNPTEIKQFSKRFRNKMDIEIDVINKFYSITEQTPEEKRTTLLEERVRQRMFYSVCLKDIENNYSRHLDYLKFDPSFFPDIQLGSPQNLIDEILERMVIQESYYVNKIAETFNSPDELKAALNNFNDVISVAVDHYSHTFTSKDIGEEDFENLKEIKFQLLTIEFFLNTDQFLKAAYIYIRNNNIIDKRYKLSIYLHSNHNIKSISDDALDEFKNNIFSKTNFIDLILIPFIDADQFIKNRTKSIYLIKTVKPNKRKFYLLAVYINEFLNDYLSFTFYNYPQRPPEIIISPGTNQVIMNQNLEVLFTIKLIKTVYNYLIRKEYVNYDDLGTFLINHLDRKVPRNDSYLLSEIQIDSNTLKAKSFSKSLLKALVNGIFYINPKQKSPSYPGTKRRKNGYEFYNKLPSINQATLEVEKEDIKKIHNEAKVFTYETMTLGYGKINEEGSVRIITTKDLILKTVCDHKYYTLVEDLD